MAIVTEAERDLLSHPQPSGPEPARPERVRPGAVRPRGSRQRPALGPLGGLVAIAVLLPLRGVWAVDVILVALVFTVPGVIALRAARIPSATVEGYPLYIPVAALLVILAGGLTADLVGPLVGISKPLHGATTALFTLGLSLLLWLIGIRAPRAARFAWRSVLEQPSLLAPLLLPALSGLGALLLSNGHGVVVARLAAVLTVLVLGGCLLRAGRLSRAQVGVVLFACALSAEWAFSIRSQEVVGFDISTEIHIAQSVQAAGIWHAFSPNNAYRAMLSITVLPSTLAALIGCSPLIAFKVLYPVLGALLPVSVFLLGERIMSRWFAAGAAALVLVQDYFFQTIPELARQEIALVFFSALVFALVDRRLRPRRRIVVVLATGLGLIVCHYSSTYLAIPLGISAIVIAVVVARFRPLPAMSAGLVCAAVVLVAGGAVWYGTITDSASNLTSLTTTFSKTGLNLLPNNGGNVILDYLSGNQVNTVSGPRFDQLAVQDYRYKTYIHPLAAAAEPQFRSQTATVPAPKVRLAPVANALSVLVTAFGELMLLVAGIGGLIMVLGRHRHDTARMVGILALGTVPLLVAVRFSGTLAESYNEDRALLQSLLLLALPAAWLAERIVRRLGRYGPAAGVTAAVTVALLFANQLGVSAMLLGGGTSLNLSQSGEDFERFYQTPAELAGAKWASTESTRQLLYSDRYGQLRLFASNGRLAFTDLTPATIDQHAWVYGDRTNVVLGRARGEIGDSAAIYRWPAKFLGTYFNTVYTDGDSTVFHR